MFCIQVVTSGVLKGYVQGAGGPNHYPIYRPLCLLGIDACIYRDMLKWNKSSFLQKFVAAWMRILLTFLISNVSWVLANITSESSHCFRKGNRNSGRRLCIMACPSFWEDYYMLIYTHFIDLLSTPTVGSWWTQWVVMAAYHCCLWWRWWSVTLWVTLMRLWLHSLSWYL